MYDKQISKPTNSLLRESDPGVIAFYYTEIQEEKMHVPLSITTAFPLFSHNPLQICCYNLQVFFSQY